jgi:5-methylcytosine-specific restriction endonuclease McrA
MKSLKASQQEANRAALDKRTHVLDRRAPGSGHHQQGRFAPRYFDQYTTPEARLPNQREVSGKVWERDRKVRDAALRRAAGRCESCKQRGFKMVGGGTYLETHHVIPLSEGGADSEANVVALCPNDHREAHHGKRREAIRRHLLGMLEGIYGR